MVNSRRYPRSIRPILSSPVRSISTMRNAVAQATTTTAASSKTLAWSTSRMLTRTSSNTTVVDHYNHQYEKEEVPVLLLEGDEFYVSHDGICRTYYELNRWSGGDVRSCSTKTLSSQPAQQQQQQQNEPLAIEEEYDLKHARKIYTLRRKGRHQTDSTTSTEPSSTSTTRRITLLSSNVEGFVNIGSPVSVPLHMQEIDQGVFGSAGTGATTWESSLAMTLLFAAQPDFLFQRGNDADGNNEKQRHTQHRVLELGSGVGVGGILTHHVMGMLTTTTTATTSATPGLFHGSMPMVSLTLTDGNDQVLDQLRQNCQRAASTAATDANSPAMMAPISVQKLLWEDATAFAAANRKSDQPIQGGGYDAILASDCAYRYPDVITLASAMKQLLAPHGKIHLFGPYNRGALHQLMLELKHTHSMEIQIDGLELNRYRLKSRASSKKGNDNHAEGGDDGECVYASKSDAKFLHITASFASPWKGTNPNGNHNGSQSLRTTLEDID